MIVSGAIGLAGQIIGLFGDRGKEKQALLKERAQNMQRTWVDEFLAVYWFSPNIVGFFSEARAQVMIDTMTRSTDVLAIQIGITAAVFGLNKLAGKK